MKNQLSAQWLPSGRRVAPGLAEDVWQVVNGERRQQLLLPQELLLLQLQLEPRPLCAPLAWPQPQCIGVQLWQRLTVAAARTRQLSRGALTLLLPLLLLLPLPLLLLLSLFVVDRARVICNNKDDKFLVICNFNARGLGLASFFFANARNLFPRTVSHSASFFLLISLCPFSLSLSRSR